MPPDARTPVIVGVGQLVRRPSGPEPGADEVAALSEPVEMMAEAARAAATDSGAHLDLLARAASVQVVSLLSWVYLNPAALLAERIGARPAETVLSSTGGNSPQMLVDRTAAAIARGELDVAVIAGAEAVYARVLARRANAPLAWTQQPPDTARPLTVGEDRPGHSDAEAAATLVLPVQFYPLFENALRAAADETIDEHQAKVAGLWSRFSQVAAANPYAWSPEARSADEIATVGPDNRMIGFPYPKLMNANIQTDQAAALIVCSVEAARSAGVPEERWVFPWAGAGAHDHWHVTERHDLSSSPAIRLAGRALFEAAGASIGDVAHVDLYSCFPSAVQIGAAALGLGTDEPDRPLTVTGGLTFAGGPGNNYVTHSIAAMCEALRRDPGSLGLVTALGWYLTKHALGLYSTEPPPAGYRSVSAQAEVDALPARVVATDAEGPATVETYTVLHERDGSPANGIVCCLLPDGRRAVATVSDPPTLLGLEKEEGCGRPVVIRQGQAEIS
ncbi:MAG TPA: acetyl-CoA acetyltransferase [Acidimicrobiales bacterium]|nr:acetyl-CoA acetyltransferase [Acidimicrobiales bacterium]